MKAKYVRKAFGEKLYCLMGNIEMPLNCISSNSMNDRSFTFVHDTGGREYDIES